jgi:hypothetical protein
LKKYSVLLISIRGTPCSGRCAAGTPNPSRVRRGAGGPRRPARSCPYALCACTSGSVPAQRVRRAACCHGARTRAASAPSGTRRSLAESLGRSGQREPPHPGRTRAHARVFPLTAMPPRRLPPRWSSWSAVTRGRAGGPRRAGPWTPSAARWRRGAPPRCAGSPASGIGWASPGSAPAGMGLALIPTIRPTCRRSPTWGRMPARTPPRG